MLLHTISFPILPVKPSLIPSETLLDMRRPILLGDQAHGRVA
jgi:hypothetical protein